MPRFALALLMALGLGTTALACDSTTPCEVEGGSYLIALPEGPPAGAVMFIHGYTSSAAAVMRNTTMTSAFLARGYAVIAPNGSPLEGRQGRAWAFPSNRPAGPFARDEIAFLLAVRDDAQARHGFAPERMLLTGYSVGGSLTSYLACAVPEGFAAYAPLSGSFWRPHPESCAGPVRLLHTHGWTDTVVPLEGRVIGEGDIEDADAFAQGDVFYAMQLWRRANGCVHGRADRFVTDGPFWRRAWDRCTEGSALELALFAGGHKIPPDWPDLTLDWFEAR